MSLAFTVIDLFTKCTGLKMNCDKTEAMQIGSSSNFRHKQNEVKWTQSPIKYLGVYIHKNLDTIVRENIKAKMEKVINLIKIWGCRQLTLRGKVTIINSLLIPQLLYIASVIYIPDETIREINKMSSDFLWNNKPSKIKYNAIINEIEQGGLKLQDLECKIKAINIS